MSATSAMAQLSTTEAPVCFTITITHKPGQWPIAPLQRSDIFHHPSVFIFSSCEYGCLWVWICWCLWSGEFLRGTIILEVYIDLPIWVPQSCRNWVRSFVMIEDLILEGLSILCIYHSMNKYACFWFKKIIEDLNFEGLRGFAWNLGTLDCWC